MTKALGVIAAVAGVALALPAAAVATHAPQAALAPRAALAPAAALANSVTFEDSTGEDPAAPDIVSTAVSNTDAGMITFQIRIPNRPQLTNDMLVFVFGDTDANPSTGDAQSLGADYVIQLFQGTVNLFRWDGTNFTQSGGVPQSSLIYSYANGVLVLKISAADFGGTKKFNFGVTAISGIVSDPSTGSFDDSNAKADLAPDPGHGFWTYEVKRAPLRLVVRSFSTKPARPAAGKPFSALLVGARSDTGAVLKGGQVTCSATVGGRHLSARTHAVVGGRATCTWTIPSSARGQTVHGSVSIRFEGLTVSRSFAARVG